MTNRFEQVMQVIAILKKSKGVVNSKNVHELATYDPDIFLVAHEFYQDMEKLRYSAEMELADKEIAEAEEAMDLGSEADQMAGYAEVE